MVVLMDGKKLSQKFQISLLSQTTYLKEHGIVPTLAVLVVGNDLASQIYFRSKKKLANKLGVNVHDRLLPENSSEQDIIKIIQNYNEDPLVHGILVELPLPKHLDEKKVIESISPAKDVDGFHPYNIGSLFMNDPGPIPCTPAGIMALFNEYHIQLAGKQVVIVGRSNIVGRPLAAMLLNADATVTIAHSKTVNLEEVTKKADILIVSIGQPEMITAKYIKPGAVIIDVGINRLSNGETVGDVNQNDVKKAADYLTPVPGGVGPMTSVMLMKQTIGFAAKELKI